MGHLKLNPHREKSHLRQRYGLKMTLTKDIRILLVDDHMVVRKGLFHVLDTVMGLEVIGEAENGKEALLLCQKMQPDIVVMDLQMGGMGGIEATRLITKFHPAIRVVGLSTFVDRDKIRDMLSAGASGYLLKDVSAQELAEAIHRVHAGEILPMPDLPEIRNSETQQTASGNLPDSVAEMGAQQKKVLALLTKGFTNSEIADHLNISPPTARYHVSAILQKLDVSNRAEAAALAIRAKLIDDTNF